MSEGRTMTVMPRYQCHKRVWALKIAALEFLANGELGITPADEGYAPFVVAKEFVPTHRPAVPQVGWYYVVYEGGYKSFSPPKDFEEGYTRI